MEINKYLDNLKASATLAINQEVKQLKLLGEKVVHFGFGQSPFPIHKSIVNALQSHAEINEYLPTLGLKELRVQISSFLEKHQNIKANWTNVFIGPGSKELLYHSILILEGEFLIPKGSWVSYLPQIKTKGGKFTILNTYIEQNFKLTPVTLEEYCKDNLDVQKILILNSPNNPTGAIYSDDELFLLAQTCKAFNLIVLSDEIYSQINFANNYSPSISTHYPERTIVFGGLSKVFSAGGYRLGFMAIPDGIQNLNETYRALFSETFSAVASPIQFAALEAYKMSDDLIEYIDRCRLILKGIGLYIFDVLEELKIQCSSPQGAFYLMIGFSNYKDQINALGIMTSDDLCEYLLKKYKIALLPGSDFYFKKDELFMRLAYVDFDGKRLLEHNSEVMEVNFDFIAENCPKIIQGIDILKGFVNELMT